MGYCGPRAVQVRNTCFLIFRAPVLTVLEQIGDSQLLPGGGWSDLSLRYYQVRAFSRKSDSRIPILQHSRASFLNLSRWLADARALGSPNLVVVLVGNKSDREEDREVEWSEASRWAAENGVCLLHIYIYISHLSQDVHFIEASSLSGDNVEAPFLLCARSVLLSIESGALDPEKAGSGVSYGDRALRRVNSSSRLSFGSLSVGRRKAGSKLKLPGAAGKCC